MKTVKDLTVKEKLRLVCGKDAWSTVDFDGKIPSIFVSDGPVGLRTVKTDENGNEHTLPAVAYPAIQVLANTWNTELSRAMGNALADDCIERDVDILLAPGVNIKRTPVCGRNFEYFSEDPILAGELAKEYIIGVQENGVGTCLKHYYVNNLEYDRLHQSSDVDDRTLREIYLKQFEIACEAKPISAMCAYNRINGVYASENKKGFDILRNEFGFDGAVISDWGAVRDRTAAAIAGLDLEMPFDQNNYDRLKADYAAGKISDEQLDACAQRVLDLVYKCAEMKARRKIKTTEAQRADVSAEILKEGAVLLKNDGILPLNKKANVSVCGCFAKPDEPAMIRGGGSAEVTRHKFDFDIPARLAERLDGKVVFESAFRYNGVNSFVQNAHTAVVNAALSDVNIVCVGTGGPVEYEAGDRQTMRLPDVQERAILETARQNRNTIVIVFAGAAVDLSAWKDEVAAILYVGFPGEKGDEVVSDILVGNINPSGKLSETFPLCYEDIASSNTRRVAGVTRYQEGLDVGYRYFDTYGEPVAFPFGHGLSYSQFEYSGLKLKAVNGDKLEVAYTVKNTSARDGKEISQVYVRECAPLVYRPYKELKAFAKTPIPAGKSVTVKTVLDISAFEYWSVAKDGKTVDDGVFEIIIGASCSDVRLTAKLSIKDGKITVL